MSIAPTTTTRYATSAVSTTIGTTTTAKTGTTTTITANGDLGTYMSLIF